MHWFAKVVSAAAVCLLVVAIPSSCSAQQQQPETLSVREAEILIYLMPRAEEVRSRGCDVSWEIEQTSGFDQADYYIFWVVHTGGPPRCRTWPTTVSYFAVNKHTADVRDISLDDYPLQKSRELERVQQAMRRVHIVDAGTIQKYRYANPEAGGSSLAPSHPG